jgi:cbb3-type cytochrome oxidase subunit 3
VETSSRRHLAKAIHIIAAIVFVVLLNLCALCLYRRHAKKKMNEDL